MNEISVLMTTEGTYPYGAGGVSTWCDALLRMTPEVRYTLLPIMMNPHIEFEVPIRRPTCRRRQRAVVGHRRAGGVLG